jgi:ubiquinone/menaquinone biosynthesis C-methylase UbiE
VPTVIEGTRGIREAYQDERTVRAYIEDRFVQPIGAMLHRRQTAALRRAILRTQPREVLELAPGPARLTTEVAPILDGGGIVLDSSLAMLGAARARLESMVPVSWQYVGGDAFNLPFRSRFDLVYVFRLIRHFDHVDRARLYAQIASVLRPGGLLLFDAVNEVAAAPVRGRARPGTLRHYDALMRPAELRAELAQAGFELISLEGLQHRFGLLSRIQILIAPRSRVLARVVMELVDRLGRGEPLEWVVTCRRA